MYIYIFHGIPVVGSSTLTPPHTGTCLALYTYSYIRRFEMVDTEYRRVVYFFYRFPSPFFSSVSVFHSLFLFRSFCPFVLSFSDLFLVSPSSLFFSLPCFPWWRILLFWYFVLALHPPPRSLRAWCMRVPLACCLLSSFLRPRCWYIVIVLLFLPFFRFRFGHRLFHPAFLLWVLCCRRGFGFCCDSFSVWYISCILIRTYTMISPFYFCLVYALFHSVPIVCIIFRLYLFFSLLIGNHPLQSYLSLSCDHELRCRDEVM